MGLDPALGATRLAVRRALADLTGGETILVACSGGADSLALLAATIFEAKVAAAHVVGVVVDHGLQAGSADHTAAVVAQMAGLGADETASIAVTVDPGGVGIEAGARTARYAALAELAAHFDAARVLLGHTRDDQAETVLLGLARGSGTRALAGMRRRFDLFDRPFLEITRAQTEAACRAEGIEPWTDPQNSDLGFARVRVRDRVLPVLEAELGPGVAAALARTAEQARADADLLDDLAEAAFARLRSGSSADEAAEAAVSAVDLAELPAALRSRVIRLAALAAGAIDAELFSSHVREVDRLVTDWHGQGRIDLPGHLHAVREGVIIVFRSSRTT